jgi:hypothetical protein
LVTARLEDIEQGHLIFELKAQPRPTGGGRPKPGKQKRH